MTELKHYGMPRRSGRYPWGSGEDPYQRNTPLRNHVKDLKDQGLTEKEIAMGLGLKISELRADISLEKDAQRQADASFAMRLKDKGYSNVAIGERMGINESSVRNLLDPIMQERALVTTRTAEMLKRQVDEKLYLDVGAGIEHQIGVPRSTLNTAIRALEKEGYRIHYTSVPQVGTGNKTSIKVLTKDTVDGKELWRNKDKIQPIAEWTNDGGRSYSKPERPVNISKDRIAVVYAEDGGKNKDGVIELRRGVEDISLGDARYAQVRIAVDGTHYLKGMAIYADDLPDGVDIRFNTNKPKGTPMMGSADNTVLKVQETGKVNPFNTEIRQKNYISKDGKELLSPINIVYEEGEWSSWADTLSSQMLSKQKPSLAKEQLDLDYQIRKDEFNDYISLTNPAVKSKLLLTFADDCDSAAVDLKAAALPRQGTHVLLPLPGIKENEIYAPNYKNGEKVVLIRHPHGGIFEIPQVTVNNNNPDAKRLFENAQDAIGIHPKVAQKLSGADFDGDTVLVIPNNSNKIEIAPSLKGLIDFDPISSYPAYPGMKNMTKAQKQDQMGKISNLITDMTIKGATPDEIARAVRHSMVVIDAEKHKLNYKQSFHDNNIAELKKIYQGGANRGAATLISRASAEERVGLRRNYYKIDPNTGKKIFIPTPESYVNKKGKVVNRTTKSTKMYEVDDAHILSSGTRMETIYADYANQLKVLGDEARRIAVNEPSISYSPSAYKAYRNEVESLKSNLRIAASNKPLERKALLLTEKRVKIAKDANPDLTPKDLKKIRGQALVTARERIGAKKISIPMKPKEWEAIQAGAVTQSFLMQILNNTDLKLIKEYATPRTKTGLSTAKLSKARLLLSRGYTQAEIAQMLGISVKTLMNAVNDTKEDGGD
jgi:DNA-binding CsgD family transcriptional regulator